MRPHLLHDENLCGDMARQTCDCDDRRWRKVGSSGLRSIAGKAFAASKLHKSRNFQTNPRLEIDISTPMDIHRSKFAELLRDFTETEPQYSARRKQRAMLPTYLSTSSSSD